MSNTNHNLAKRRELTTKPETGFAGPGYDMAHSHDTAVLPTVAPANDNSQREQLDAYWQASRTHSSRPWQSAFTKMWWLP
ncbi:hypothetical protein [Parasphingorhabdus sp.]|uniref:hypothetical protein n=1 Tax=Parasphingorhabdus sp. TaxID=2709688 RepID=UPI0032672256